MLCILSLKSVENRRRGRRLAVTTQTALDVQITPSGDAVRTPSHVALRHMISTMYKLTLSQ